MLKNYDERISSFFEVSRMITEGGSSYNEFDEYERGIYREFAGNLVSIFSKIDPTASYLTDTDKIIQELDNLYQNSMLEDYVQNVVELARCFVKGAYTYYNRNRIEVSTVLSFIKLLKGLSKEKQKIVMTHLWKRLDSVSREDKAPESDDLPF